MIEGIEELNAKSGCIPQTNPDGTKNMEWFRQRIGCITSSKVSMVMMESAEVKAWKKAVYALMDENPKLKKGQTLEDYRNEIQAQLPALAEAARLEPFSDTAKGYFYQVAAERNLKENVLSDDEFFGAYLERVDISSKAIRMGNELESVAREQFGTLSGLEIVECGFIRHTDVPNYGDSPDGIILDKDGKPYAALEIKCPKPDKWMRYKTTIHDAASLKEEKPEYYWQCMSHMEVNHLNYCYFVFFDWMQKNSLQAILLERNDNDIEDMLERVIQANNYIDNVILK